MKKDYFPAHVMLVNWLRLLGVYYSINDRLPLAWYRHHVTKLTDDPKKLAAIRALIDECVVMRREGHEPEHKDERYT